MKRTSLVITCIVVSSLAAMTTFTAFSHHLSDHYGGQFRLPLNGSRYISNGPGEGSHLNASSEAIDYPASFAVYAPADGNILDVLFVNDFGWVVRINHPDPQNPGAGIVSFFAHMEQNSVSNWNVADPVYQGQLIGTSSDTGTGASGDHLHFELRTGAVHSNVYSGTSVAITGIPGQWWNKWYSPSPNFQTNPSEFSGAAQYPPVNILPSQLPSAGYPPRHLSNWTSPSDEPATYMTNVSNSFVVLHWGGRPSTPSDPQLETYFQTQEYVTGIGWRSQYGWYTSIASLGITVNSSNQCTPSNQHCHVIWSRNNQNGWSTPRTFYFYPGNTATGQPYVSVSYRYGATNPDLAVINYDRANATWFNVWEDTPAANPPTSIYYGQAKSIIVQHQSNRSYTVQAWVPGQGWTSSPWIVP